jgi:HEAT repeat protein
MTDKVSEMMNLSYVIGSLIVLVFIVLLSFRFRSIWMERQNRYYLHKHQDYFDYVKTHLYEDAQLQKPPGHLTKSELQVIQMKLFEWMKKIVGDECKKLTDLCRDLGLVDFNMKRLQSEIHFTRLDAVYNLGFMQVKEAVPMFLQLLEEERYGSSAFVIARAISNCAQSEEELDQMVRILVKHDKQSHRLVSGVLVLTRIDCTPLLMGYLKEEDIELVKVGLMGLQNRSIPGAYDILSSYVELNDPELKILAVQALVRQGMHMAPEQMSELMKHDDVDVRAEAAEAFGQVGVVASVDSLKEGLEDSDLRVRYNSARSLVGLDNAGFRALCEVVLHGGDSRQASLANEVIQEELSNGSLYSDDLEQAIRYNDRISIYRQLFGGQVSVGKENRVRLEAVKGDTA